MADSDPDGRITESYVPGAADGDVGGTQSFYRLNKALRVVAGTLMFALLALTFVDVVGRYAFNRPIPGGFEIIEFNMGLLIFAALPLVTRDRGHITVGLFDSFMSAAVRRFRETIVLLGSVGVVGFISLLMFRSGLEMLEANTVSRVYDFPLAPVVFVICGLGVITTLVLVAMIWQHLRGIAASADTGASG